MYKRLLAILLLVCSLSGYAQRDTSLTTSVEITYYVLDIVPMKAKIKAYFSENKIDVISMNDNRDNLKASFFLDPAAFESFQALSASWAPIARQNVSSENHIARIAELESNIRFKQQEIEEYDKVLTEIPKENNSYLDLWRKQRLLAEELHRLNNEKAVFQKKHHNYLVKIDVQEEKNPTDYDSFSLVNMPGVEYAYLSIENPKPGFSANQYHGMFLKYMFTRGKTYGLIGAFKDLAANDAGNIDELFLFAMGQDFYSRYLGRGARKSLNLYSSFNAGYIKATSEVTEWSSWYMSAFVGLELLKTKYLLLDNKIGYFIPFSEGRSMRGLSYRVSFNFVF